VPSENCTGYRQRIISLHLSFPFLHQHILLSKNTLNAPGKSNKLALTGDRLYISSCWYTRICFQRLIFPGRNGLPEKDFIDPSKSGPA